MKSKILFSVYLFSLSMNIFSLPEGVRIINEKVTITPGYVGGFYSRTEKKSTSPSTAQARVSVIGTSGKVNDYIKIDANHSVDINNRESEYRRFTYKYELKCDDGSANYERTIELKPRTSFHDNSYSYLSVQKAQPGNYRIEASTKIEGPESHSSKESANLIIYK